MEGSICRQKELVATPSMEVDPKKSVQDMESDIICNI